jgi:hypothetical protein
LPPPKLEAGLLARKSCSSIWTKLNMQTLKVVLTHPFVCNNDIGVCPLFLVVWSVMSVVSTNTKWPCVLLDCYTCWIISQPPTGPSHSVCGIEFVSKRMLSPSQFDGHGSRCERAAHASLPGLQGHVPHHLQPIGSKSSHSSILPITQP